MATQDAKLTMTCVKAAHEVLRAVTLDSEGSIAEARGVYLNAATLLLESRHKDRMQPESIKCMEKIAEGCMARVEGIELRSQITFVLTRHFYESVCDLVLELSKCQMYEESLRAQLHKKAEELISCAEFVLSNQDNFRPAPIPDSQPSGYDDPMKPINPPQPAGNLTESEKRILYKTSYMKKKNERVRREFLPWEDDDVKKINTNPNTPYRDPHGSLELSPKQLRVFGGWKRPKKFYSNPKILRGTLKPHAVTQHLVPDCSFVSSLIAVAEYQRRFKRPLITSIIYPQSAAGVPVYNPGGQYLLKLNINGIPRRVDIDDYLPVATDGRLICSHSTKDDELWVSLLEKAFLKVMGGYNFPGSSSEVDLFTLTGWVPEKTYTQVPKFQEEGEKEKAWSRMRDGHCFGKCLMTMSTTSLDERDERELGLVSKHAYAVLDVREIPMYNLRILKLKNPWAERRWQGRFSYRDTQSWTRDLQSALGYDLEKARVNDDGIFWIDWVSALNYFSTIHFNWNPDLFKVPHAVHSYWPAPVRGDLSRGPSGGSSKSDRINYGHCPQFRITLKDFNNCANVGIWIHLSKHILEDPTAPNEDYLAIHVFRPSGKDEGKRVYYPDNYLSNGTYIDSLHRLTRLDVTPEKGEQTITVVVVISLFERLRDVYFTLRVYSEDAMIDFQEIPHQYPYEITPILTKWSDEPPVIADTSDSFLSDNDKSRVLEIVTSRLSLGPLGWKVFSVRTTELSEIMLEIHGEKEVAHNMYLINPSGEMMISSRIYRSGFIYLRETVDPGVYALVVVNFEKKGDKQFFISGGAAAGTLEVASITT